MSAQATFTQEGHLPKHLAPTLLRQHLQEGGCKIVILFSGFLWAMLDSSAE